MIALATVHTSGINWASIGTIAGIVFFAFSMMTWFLMRREKRSDEQNEQIKEQISTAVNALGDRLILQLETKEVVAKISERLARVEGAMRLDGTKTTL